MQSAKMTLVVTQFVYTDYQNDFESYAMDSVYRSVESDVYNNRNQSLPIVTNVGFTKVGHEFYTYVASTDDNAYVCNFKIAYEDDLGYPTEGSLILIHSNDKLEIAAMNYEK